MLVFTRKVGETVMVGDEVEITVLEIRDGRVRLGLTAPDEVSLHRGEVYARIAEEGLRRGSRPA